MSADATRNKLCASYRLVRRRKKKAKFVYARDSRSLSGSTALKCLHVVVCVGHGTIWTCGVSHRHRSESRLKAETPFIFFGSRATHTSN
jgi:hypothetical protein